MVSRILSLAFAIVTLGLGAVQAQTPDHRSITVSGHAVVPVEPDMAVISFGIKNLDSSLQIARRQTDVRADRLKEFCIDLGIKVDDIKSTYVSVRPVHRFIEGEETFRGYDVSNTVRVTLRSLADYDALINQALEAGIDRIQYVEFRTSSPRRYEDEARRAALKAAREKAEDMVAVFDAGLGEVISIAETEPPPAGWFRLQPYANVMGGKAAPGGPEMSTVMPGLLQIEAAVTVVFAIE
jgi:uncharacterized protein YggE